MFDMALNTLKKNIASEIKLASRKYESNSSLGSNTFVLQS